MSRTPDQAAALWRERAREGHYHPMAETARTLARELFEAVNTCATREDMHAVIAGCLLHMAGAADTEAERAIRTASDTARRNATLAAVAKMRETLLKIESA